MKFHSMTDQRIEQTLCWTAPPVGWCKLNTDGSFGIWWDGRSRNAGPRLQGEIIVSACRQLSNCRDVVGAELNAVFEGISLALQWCNEPVIIETDCLELVKLLGQMDVDRSAYSPIV
jgi:hypothetical protein